MLKEVIDAQRVVREGVDDLAEIRQMIAKTKVNINTHINTVDHLKKLSKKNQKLPKKIKIQ